MHCSVFPNPARIVHSRVVGSAQALATFSGPGAKSLTPATVARARVRYGRSIQPTRAAARTPAFGTDETKQVDA